MELIVSNIAWTSKEEPTIAEKLRELGIKHVEIAPTKTWADPTSITFEQAREYVDWWSRYDITISAFQSMLFARPDLKLFESDTNRQETIEYMARFLELAGTMNASKLVFGSPKNRQRGGMSIEKASQVASAFFGELGDVALKNNVILCLEPNARQYNCDFITNATEGSHFVRQVNNHGFGLHLDTACMALAGDDFGASIRESKDILEHFHISVPMLAQVGSRDGVNHQSAAEALREIGYDKFISIEMRPGEVGTNAARVEEAVKFVQKMYLDN